MIYFTSDLHLGHKRMLEYRPFKALYEMDNTIIRNWNTVVDPKDVVYILGDFSFYSRDKTIELLKNLNGHKILIKGNHDKDKRVLGAFNEVYDLKKIKVPDNDVPRNTQEIVLCHYAMRIWDKKHFGSWHLYGHSHGNMPEDPNSKSFDVGVDAWNYFPISYEQVKEKMKTKGFEALDHHIAKEYKNE